MHKHTFCPLKEPVQTIRLWIILTMSRFGLLYVFFVSWAYYWCHFMSSRSCLWIHMHKQMNMKCNSRADNTTAFRQVQKIPEENQLSSDFQIFHKNQIKSSAGALFWFWNIYKSMKSRKFSSYLNQNRDFCSLEVKKKVSTKALFGQELIHLSKHKTNT